MKEGIFKVLIVVLVLTIPRDVAAIPSDGWIVWASDREEGRHEIYLMKADGSGVTRLTQSGAKYPAWSPDGRWIAYRNTNDNTIHVVRYDKSIDKKIFQGDDGYVFWMHDNSGLVCGSNGNYSLVNPETGASKPLFKKSDFPQFGSAALALGAFTADRRWALGWTDLYKDGYTGTNGSFTASGPVILDLQDKSKINYFGPGCEPTTSPTGDWIYHVFGGEWPNTQIYKMNIKDLASRSSYGVEIGYPDADWGHEYFPRISTDGKWLTYGATTGCHDHDTCDYEIFIHALGNATDRTRVTTNPANDQWPHMFVGTLPTICADGKLCGDLRVSTIEAGPGPAPSSDAGIIAVTEGGNEGGTSQASKMREALAGGCSISGTPPGCGEMLVLLVVGLTALALRRRLRRQVHVCCRSGMQRSAAAEAGRL